MRLIQKARAEAEMPRHFLQHIERSVACCLPRPCVKQPFIPAKKPVLVKKIFHSGLFHTFILTQFMVYCHIIVERWMFLRPAQRGGSFSRFRQEV